MACYRIFQYRNFRFNQFCRIASVRRVLGPSRAIQNRRHVFGRCPATGECHARRTGCENSVNLRVSCPNMNVASAGSMSSNCLSYRGHSALIPSNSLPRSRGQPGVPTGSAADYPLRTKPKNVPSGSRPKNTVSRIPCTKSILEPLDEHLDTPDRKSLQSREAALAATGAPERAIPGSCPSRPRTDPSIEMTVRSAKLCGSPELLEPDSQPVPIGTILIPPRQSDHPPGDPLQPASEERAVMDFEEPRVRREFLQSRSTPIRWASKAA